MHAVVLAGGYATRLWPINHHRPKMLLPIGHTTVIDRILEQLEVDSRINNVYISTNERFADDFETHLTKSSLTKPQLSIEETLQEDEKLGVIGALAQLVDREGLADEDLLVVAGDNLISFDLSEFIDTFERGQNPLLAAYDIGSQRKASKYGVVELDGTRVVDFEEKPDSPASSLISIACYTFPACDIRFEEYLDAVSWALNGDAVIAPNATVENTDLGKNVHVMSGATVTDSTLERLIVFPEATIENSDLRDSIVDHKATVRDLNLGGALVGAHSQLP